MQYELIEIQTQLSFQEDLLTQLNEVVIQQQQEINRLKVYTEDLKIQFDELYNNQDKSEKNFIPPHY